MRGGTTHPSKCGTPLGTPKTTPWFWERQRSYEGACRWDFPPIQATGEGNLTEALPAFPEQFKQRDQTELPLTPCLPLPTPKRLDSRQERAAWKLFSGLNRPRLRQTCVQRAPQAPIYIWEGNLHGNSVDTCRKAWEEKAAEHRSKPAKSTPHKGILGG